MAWPKGVKRKGYIKKADRDKAQVKADPVSSPTPESSSAPDVEEDLQLWGMKGTGAITEPCPNCLYAYADGGYCQECGWMAPIPIDEYGTNSGKRF